MKNEIFLLPFLPLGQYGLGVLRSPASVRPSVCPSVYFLHVLTITFERTYLESSNLVYMGILGISWMGLHMVTFDLDLQGHLGQKRSKLAENGLVLAITFEGL